MRIAPGIAHLVLGWALATVAGRSGAALLTRRGVQPAGPLGFVVRLASIRATLVVALRIVGLEPETVAIGGAATAIVAGLAAQQTLAGQLEGVVVDAGLLYTHLARGADRILVPNSVLLNSAVVPLREPGSVDLRVRLDGDVQPTELQARLERGVSTPIRSAPHIQVEEFDGSSVILRVQVTPVLDEQGPRLANEVLSALRAA